MTPKMSLGLMHFKYVLRWKDVILPKHPLGICNGNVDDRFVVDAKNKFEIHAV